MKRLPVLHVLSEALDIVWMNRMALFVVLVPVSLVYLLFTYVIRHLSIWDGDISMSDVLLGNLLMVFYVPIYTAFAVTVHRMILIGNRAVPWYGQLLFGYRELKFCLFVVVIWVLYFMVVTILANLLGNAVEISSLSTPVYIFWVMFTAKLIAAYPLARFSLTFPAIAVDYFFGLNKIWYLSKGNSLRLYLCVSVLPAFFWLLMSYLPWTSYVLVDALWSFAMFVMFAVEIAILSACFKWLVHSIESEAKEGEEKVSRTGQN